MRASAGSTAPRQIAKRIQPITAAGANNGTATVTTIHTDFLGSPVAETNSAGTVTRVERYTPYGEPADLQLDVGPGFTGHATDVATGLTYMQQRYYDADIGRFISPDPVGPEEDFIKHFNRYNYALNNPVSNIDPDGRKSCAEPGSISCNHPSVTSASLGALPSSMGGGPRTRGGVRSANNVGTKTEVKKPNVEEQKHGTAGTKSNGFSVKGLLVGKPAVTASGMAAAGGGIQVTKGIYNADSSAGIVTPALALTASADVNMINISYEGSNATKAPVEMRFGLHAEGHAIFGGRLSIGYTPPSSFDLSVDAGAGLGLGFHFYEVNAVIEED